MSLAVIVLSFNEEANIAGALSSVCGWADQVFVLDSFSKDRTLEEAGRFPCVIAQHAFENYGAQRNFALDHLGITSEWVLFLDADEWVPDDLKAEISRTIERDPSENGFYIKRKLIWMKKWIRHGYYPAWILRLFRHGKARCEHRPVNEHMIVEGQVGYLKTDFMHEDRKGLSPWIDKHNRYATLEARELLAENGQNHLRANLFGSPTERKRWLLRHVWRRCPVMLRPILFFSYRYILRCGFLDGREGLLYHFFQGLWLHMLISAKYLEMRQLDPSGADAPGQDPYKAQTQYAERLP